MNRASYAVKAMLKPINPYSALILAAFTFCWGAWLISPFWVAFDRAAIFSKAAEFAPEWAWGLWSVAAGISVVVEVVKMQSKWLCRSLAFIAWHWATVACMTWWGDWQNTAGITYTFAAIFSIYAYLNIKINYKFPPDPE